ncbi:MAG: ThiF family adenylyltransferase [Candidatus Micrarchaeota archaeon]|nr:ThiF family adenylyltransferase [Candidatus Micrarchaeota archaeon]
MRVTVVGAGGVGAQTLLELSQTSHHITIIDRDIVDDDTLLRQALYAKTDVGRRKAFAAAEKLGPSFSARCDHLCFENAATLLSGANIVLDCTDNWATRCAINHWALKNGKQWIYTSAIRRETMATTLTPKTPCFVCWNPVPATPRSCRAEGITREATAAAAKTQVLEFAGLLAGAPRLAGILQYTDTAAKTCATTPLSKNPACPACVKKTFRPPAQKAAVLCGDGEYLFEAKTTFSKEALASLCPKSFGDVMKIEWKKGELVIFKNGRVLSRGLSEANATAAVEAMVQKQER